MAIKKTSQPKSRETQQAPRTEQTPRAKQAKPLSYAEVRLFHGGCEGCAA